MHSSTIPQDSAPTPSPDFIQVFDDVFSESECAALIERFTQSPQRTVGSTGNTTDLAVKHSQDITLDVHEEWRDALTALTAGVSTCVFKYFRLFPHLLFKELVVGSGDQTRRIAPSNFHMFDDQSLIRIFTDHFVPGYTNIQRYEADIGGYHSWHSEIAPIDLLTLHRVLFWIVYLNDDFDEGETEFYYQRIRIKPRTGRVVISPAGFTHTHRGNVPKNGDKYIATSWIMYKPVTLPVETTAQQP
jgi:hypothetical protein